jgi:hypothetical protein
MFLLGDVHHVDLSTAALAVDEMLRRGVDVPPDAEDLLPIEIEAGEALNFSLRVVWCPGWCKLPVEEVAGDGFVLIAFEVGLVVDRKVLLSYIDGRLVSSRLA